MEEMREQLDRLLSDSHQSKEDFINGYNALKCSEFNGEEFYLLILCELKEAVVKGNAENFKKLCSAIEWLNEVETSSNYFESDQNPLRGSNLIILACRNERPDILELLLSPDGKLGNALDLIGASSALPHDVDENSHNAFYYAMRSGNINVLEMLITNWPGDFFSIHKEQLEEILSTTYEELKIRQVPLIEAVEIYVENELINSRFVSNEEIENAQSYDLVKDRIKWVLEHVKLLNSKYSSGEKVSTAFLSIAKVVAQNINILKRQLKSTYDKLPWEEIEFCLLCFISSKTKRQDLNVFYNAVLSKSKILRYLSHFSKHLNKISECAEFNTFVNTEFPKEERNHVVKRIVSTRNQYEQLYNDYQKLREVYSFQRMSSYTKLALQADAAKREGQAAIMRALQVVGECMKTSLASPNLSAMASELVAVSLPMTLRDFILNLRDSTSQFYSLSKRLEFEESANFAQVQHAVTKIERVVTDLYLVARAKISRIVLEKLVKINTLDEVKEAVKWFDNVDFEVTIDTSGSFGSIDFRIERLLIEYRMKLTQPTEYEKKLFETIGDILSSADGDCNESFRSFELLKRLISTLDDKLLDLEDMKRTAKTMLASISPTLDADSLGRIVMISSQICDSVRFRYHSDSLDEISATVFAIMYTAKNETEDFVFIDCLKRNLMDEISYLTSKRRNCEVVDATYHEELKLKRSELKEALAKNETAEDTVGNLPFHKRNWTLRAAVEVFVLDIMLIMDRSKNIATPDLSYLEDYTQPLTGHTLLHYLAHDNLLIDVLVSEPAISVFLSAEKLVAEDFIEERMGRLLKDDPLKNREKLSECLTRVENQANMLHALTKGNFNDLKNSVSNGADIFAEFENRQRSFHVAVRNNCDIEILKFIHDLKLTCNVKNATGQTPLHLAAELGKEEIIEFLITNGGAFVDEIDRHGETPIHIAAKSGHKGPVELLLKHHADVYIKNVVGLSPLHEAVKNGHLDIVKILLQKETHADKNPTKAGITSLSLAVVAGHVEIVNVLLEKGANVHPRIEGASGPLHDAANFGHVEIVDALIRRGANVNAKSKEDRTPLSMAAEFGHVKVVQILVDHGADINVVETSHQNSVLHTASFHGHDKIVDILLAKKVNADVVNDQLSTPFHLAAHQGHLRVVESLIKYGVNTRAVDLMQQFSALHHAAQAGHAEVVDCLIRNGVPIDNKSGAGETPLHQAAQGGYNEVVQMLIKKGANVIARDRDDDTPLHGAAKIGSVDTIELLVKYKAGVNAKNKAGMTPLSFAVFFGHEEAVACLIKHKANVNAKNNEGVAPLFTAAANNFPGIVKMLLRNKADVDAFITQPKKETALTVAMKGEYQEVVALLLENDVNVNIQLDDGTTPLTYAIMHNQLANVRSLLRYGARFGDTNFDYVSYAVLSGFSDIFDVLLKHKARVDMKDRHGRGLLHFASEGGHMSLVNTLLNKGIPVDDASFSGTTPLHMAVLRGRLEVAEHLISEGADVDAADENSAVLHKAVLSGDADIVELILNNRANINATDKERRTALELAVMYGHVQVVRVLMKFRNFDFNAQYGNSSLLHLATQGGNLAMVKFLVDNGCDINKKDYLGSNAMNYAAKFGLIDIVKFFVSKGIDVNEPGSRSHTPIFMAVFANNLEVVQFLIEKGADVNFKCSTNLTPLHLACVHARRPVFKALLDAGAIFNEMSPVGQTPVQMAKDAEAVALLQQTEKLFEAVSLDNAYEVENWIMSGASTNARNTLGGTALHLAASKGHEQIALILLKHEANPNRTAAKGYTPLHFAAKASHFRIVQMLLSHCAIHNLTTDAGKTPLDLARSGGVSSLLKFVGDCFEKAKDGNADLINDLNGIQDIDTLRAVMNSSNKEKQSLLVAAIRGNIANVKELESFCERAAPPDVESGWLRRQQGRHALASLDLARALRRISATTGDNLGTVYLRTKIAKLFCKLWSYNEPLPSVEIIYRTQKAFYGINDVATLRSRRFFGKLLHLNGKIEDALHVLEDVYKRQKEHLGLDHIETLLTQYHRATVMNDLSRHREAIALHRLVIQTCENLYGENSVLAVKAQCGIGKTLENQGKYEEALSVQKKVLKKRELILGITHVKTMMSSYIISRLLSYLGEKEQALHELRKLSYAQKKVLPQNHRDVVDTHFLMGNIRFDLRKWFASYNSFRACNVQREQLFGKGHPTVTEAHRKMNEMVRFLNHYGYTEQQFFNYLGTDLCVVVAKGDIALLRRIIQDGGDVNDIYVDGKTLLHLAAGHEKTAIVKLLIDSGADITAVTEKGNTPLHTAAIKQNMVIARLLLEKAKKDELHDLVNARSTIGGATPLHVAATKGHYDMVKTLLHHGAIYDLERSDGNRPIDLAKDTNSVQLLKLIDELFMEKERSAVLEKLKTVPTDKVSAVLNARNGENKTLLQDAQANADNNTIEGVLMKLLAPMNLQGSR